MIAVEHVIIRFPLPGENRVADFACQVREVVDMGGGIFSYGEPKTLEPKRLAEIGVTLESVLGKGNTELMVRVVAAEEKLSATEQERDAVIAANELQARHIAALTPAPETAKTAAKKKG